MSSSCIYSQHRRCLLVSTNIFFLLTNLFFLSVQYFQSCETIRDVLKNKKINRTLTFLLYLYDISPIIENPE